MDPSVPDVDESVFNPNNYWKEFYGDVVEKDPHRISEPLGNPLYVGCFVNSDHRYNVITRRSHSGILLFDNSALIDSFGKRQNTVELSPFGSELVAMRITRDMIVKIRIKF